jgi:hypothetical protein
MSEQACPNCKRRPETDSDACYYCGSSLDPDNLEGQPPTPEERAAMAREMDAVAPTPTDKFQLMFVQRPTPRTDAIKAEYLQSTPVPWTALMTCGTIERELAEARELVEMYKEAKEEFSQYSERRNLEKRLAAAIRERDNAESDRKQAEADTIRALHERNEAREQRDQLAVALRQCMPIIGKPGRPDEWIWADDDVLDKAWKDGQSALAALKGGTDEHHSPLAAIAVGCGDRSEFSPACRIFLNGSRN